MLFHNKITNIEPEWIKKKQAKKSFIGLVVFLLLHSGRGLPYVLYSWAIYFKKKCGITEKNLQRIQMWMTQSLEDESYEKKKKWFFFFLF